MPQYLVATYHPDNYDPSIETEAMSHKKRGDCSQLFPAGADPCRRLGRIPETRASYKKPSPWRGRSGSAAFSRGD